MTALTGTLLPAAGVPKEQSRRGNRLSVSDEQHKLNKPKWDALLGRVAHGESVAHAIKTLLISPSMLDGHLISDKKAKEQLADAKVQSLRRIWNEDTVEEVLVAIAMGSTVKQACELVFMEDKVDSFFKLVFRDPGVKEAYEEARMIQAEKMAIDDVIEISDNTENDETFDGRPNTAAVNRDRLKVDSRKWIASKLHHKRFGDRIQQDIEQNIVIDHAARLEAARKRRDDAISKSKK